MPKIDRKKVQDVEKFTIRSSFTQNVESFFAPHDTTIGLQGFKNSDLTVLGNLYVCGSINGTVISQSESSTTGSSSLDSNAQYILQQSNFELPEARYLSAGSNISLIDHGATGEVDIYAFPSGSGLVKALQFNESDAFSYDDKLHFITDTSTLVITGTVDAQNVPWINDGMGVTNAFRRRINVFPWLAGSYLSWDIAFTNGYLAPQQFSFYEVAYNGDRRYAHGAVQDANTSISVGSPDVGSSQLVMNVRNRPVLRGMIQMPTSSIQNIGVAIGFAPYRTSKLTEDRPQWPSIYGNTYYALLHYFNEVGSRFAGGSSRNGSLGLQRYRSSNSWHLISCGSSDTFQNATNLGVTAVVGGRYYFNIELGETSTSVSIESVDSFGSSVFGNASHNLTIPNTTTLGWTVELSIHGLNPGATDPRDFGVFGLQLEY
jgi:hypothetical protein